LVGAERKHLALLAAIEQAERVLHPVEAAQRFLVADPQRPRQPPRFDIARADVEHLARAHHIVQRLKRLVERRLGIGLVNEVHVEAVGLQPREALVDLLQNVARESPSIVGARVRPG
jgi:hypothetical protein